jgi:DNA-binding NtrC family response regulator
MDSRTPASQPVVVCIDDEPAVLASLRRALRHEPYEVVTISDPRSALDYISSRDVDVVITDQRMPEMTGTQLLLAARDRAPDMEGVLLTAYASALPIGERMAYGRPRLITKPWLDDDLRQTVGELLKRRSRRRIVAEASVKAWTTPDIAEPLLRIDCRYNKVRSLVDQAIRVLDAKAPSARGVAVLLENLSLIEDSMLELVRTLVDQLGSEGRALSLVDPAGQSAGVLDILKDTAVGAVYGPELLSSGIQSVLVVEDHPATQEYLGELLNAAGAASVLGSSVTEVLAQVEASPFDLAFLDLGVPEGGAIALSQKLLQRNPRIDIVALSTCSNLWDQNTCDRLGIWRRLEKPYRVGDLLRALQEGGHSGKEG